MRYFKAFLVPLLGFMLPLLFLSSTALGVDGGWRFGSYQDHRTLKSNNGRTNYDFELNGGSFSLRYEDLEGAVSYLRGEGVLNDGTKDWRGAGDQEPIYLFSDNETYEVQSIEAAALDFECRFWATSRRSRHALLVISGGERAQYAFLTDKETLSLWTGSYLIGLGYVYKMGVIHFEVTGRWHIDAAKNEGFSMSSSTRLGLVLEFE